MVNIVAGVFLILLGIIVIISVFIWIVSNIKISMNSTKYNKISSIAMVVIVILFIIIFPILLKTSNIFENFDNGFPNNPPKFPSNPPNNTPTNPPQSNNSSMQYGRSGNQPTGTITFKQPFQNIVFLH